MSDQTAAIVQQIIDGRTRITELEQRIAELVDAWDALPGGQHGHRAVDAWLGSYMAPAIRKARHAIQTQNAVTK